MIPVEGSLTLEISTQRPTRFVLIFVRLFGNKSERRQKLSA